MQRRHARRRLQLGRELERMRAYAELHDCRRRYLLDYLGQDATPCDRCDNCEHGLPPGDEHPFPQHTRVVHRVLGKGVVLGYSGDSMRVLFDASGEKTLQTSFVTQRGLLEPF